MIEQSGSQFSLKEVYKSRVEKKLEERNSARIGMVKHRIGGFQPKKPLEAPRPQNWRDWLKGADEED